MDGTKYAPTPLVTASALQEPDIERFKQYEYNDEQVGAVMPYNLYLPENYDPNKKYPLLFFVADASANINAVKTPLFQGNGAVVWTYGMEQKKRECIVLAPQYTKDLVEKLGMLTTDENVWTPGLTLVTDLLLDVINRYSVDKNRIYGTGQSQGGMANIAISDKYPDLFAAQWLVACQWNTAEMAAAGYPINYTVFAGGNHMYTWSFAYDIEAIREWLFRQTRDGQKVDDRYPKVRF